jgi:putative aldouronate transport system permease protein
MVKARRKNELKINSGFSEKMFDIMVYSFLVFLAITSLYPLLHVAFSSFSDGNQLISHRGLMWKSLGFSFEAYKAVFANSTVIRGYGNTLFIVVVGVITNLTVTALGAYVLSRKHVLLNKYFMTIIVFTMFFNGGLIPFYLVVKGIGLINSLWAVIIPFAVNTFNLIIMRTSFKSVPEALEESAKIDGANHFTIFTKVVLPLSMPVIAVMALYYAVDKWNGWFYASIFIKDREMYPLQLLLREILISNNTDSISIGAVAGDSFQIGETIKYATIMVATVPILCIYPFLQKYFVKGALVGALKG